MTENFKSPDALSGGRPVRTITAGVWLAAGLAGCALQPPTAPVTTPVPTAWQAPLPHNGSLADLSAWWQQQNDPLLTELIMAAETVSPTVATARSNIEQARVARIVSGAALLPRIDSNVNVTRGRSNPVNGAQLPIATTATAAVQASWEIDIFGLNGSQRDADQQRFEGSQADWHGARVSVAAETANQYYALRACEKLLAVARSDASSRAETSRLTDLSMKAGFTAPATAALARASAAEGRNNAAQQAALCEVDVKALVALTAYEEPALRQRLAASPPDAIQETAPPVISVPAQALAQRPDIFKAAREVDAAHADVGYARALRYPRLGLNGSLSSSKSWTNNGSQRFETWSVGPLQLTLPPLDGGASKANVNAAIARYDNAAAQYRGAVRQAVREVEEARVNLDSTADRTQSAAVAAEGYSASFTGTEARYKSGLANLVELEDARRTLLASQSNVVNLQRQRRSAWVSLYRALGGGWTVDSAAPETADAAPPPAFSPSPTADTTLLSTARPGS